MGIWFLRKIRKSGSIGENRWIHSLLGVFNLIQIMALDMESLPLLLFLVWEQYQFVRRKLHRNIVEF